jgi:hypothetical protein
VVTIHALFVGFFAVIALIDLRRALAILLIGTLVLGVWMPPKAQAQIGLGSLFTAINAVLNTINGVLRSLLNTANSILSQVGSILGEFRDLMQTVVYPQALIDQARSMVSSIIAQFRGLLSSIFNIGVGSATLPAPSSLESIIRNRNAADIGAVAGAYTRTFGALPPVTDADPRERNLIDIDDALAQGQLKLLKAADAVSDQTIAASLLIEDEARIAAPGTADYLIAAGLIASVQNQAVMQKMVAAQMRQEAARIAHDNMLRKRNAATASRLRENMSRMLQR